MMSDYTVRWYGLLSDSDLVIKLLDLPYYRTLLLSVLKKPVDSVDPLNTDRTYWKVECTVEVFFPPQVGIY